MVDLCLVYHYVNGWKQIFNNQSADLWQRAYEEFKVRVNALVAKAQKTPDEGWSMQDGTAWPGNNPRDHPGMIQVKHYSFDSICVILLIEKNAHLLFYVSFKFILCIMKCSTL